LAEDPYKDERVIPLKFQDEVKAPEKNEQGEDHNDEAHHQETIKYVVYSWGNGWGGKLGHGNFENQFVPKMI